MAPELVGAADVVALCAVLFSLVLSMVSFVCWRKKWMVILVWVSILTLFVGSEIQEKRIFREKPSCSPQSLSWHPISRIVVLDPRASRSVHWG